MAGRPVGCGGESARNQGGLLDGHGASLVEERGECAFVELPIEYVARGVLGGRLHPLHRGASAPEELGRGAQQPGGSFGLSAFGERPSEAHGSGSGGGEVSGRESPAEGFLGQLRGLGVSPLEVGDVGKVQLQHCDNVCSRAGSRAGREGFVAEDPGLIEPALGDRDVGEV